MIDKTTAWFQSVPKVVNTVLADAHEGRLDGRAILIP